jgi:hypothetical protein
MSSSIWKAKRKGDRGLGPGYSKTRQKQQDPLFPGKYLPRREIKPVFPFPFLRNHPANILPRIALKKQQNPPFCPLKIYSARRIFPGILY